MEPIWCAYVQEQVRHEYECVYICAMCCAEHPIQAAKQTLRQPNEKAQHIQWAVRRAKQQNRERNIVQIGRALHGAMNKHDPAHTWARTTGALHKHRARNKKKKKRGKVCVSCVVICVSCVDFLLLFLKEMDPGMWWQWSGQFCLVSMCGSVACYV